MNVHIGEIIRKELRDKGISLRKFADHMGMTERNVQHFLKRSDIHGSQLQRVSEFLGEDLTVYFKPKGAAENNLVNDPAERYVRNVKLIKVNVEVMGDMATMKKFPDFLEDINTAAIKLGFKITS